MLEQLRSGAPIENVAAITFTVPAAAELAVRLREEILRRCREAASPAEAALWRRAEAGLDAAAISTIHSFCASLLRRFPAEAGVDPRFRGGDDDSAVSPIFERALEKWRGEVFSVPSGVPESVPLERALAVGITVPRMETALAALRSSPELVASFAVGAAEVPFPAAVVRDFRDRIAFLEQSLGDALDREDKLAEGLRQALEEAGPLLALDDESLALALVDDEEPLPVSLQGGPRRSGGEARCRSIG